MNKNSKNILETRSRGSSLASRGNYSDGGGMTDSGKYKNSEAEEGSNRRYMDGGSGSRKSIKKV